MKGVHSSLISVVVLLLIVSPIGGFAGQTGAATPQEIDSCTTITKPGTYVLTRDLDVPQASDQDACITISPISGSVTFDGQDHLIWWTLSGSHTPGTAVLVEGPRRDRVVVKNLRIRRLDRGVVFENVNAGEISHISVWDQPKQGPGILLRSSNNVMVADNAIADRVRGIALEGSENNVIRDNTIRRGAFLVRAEGLIILEASNGNELRGNTVAQNRGPGIVVESSRDNVVRSNHVTNNDVGILVTSSRTLGGPERTLDVSRSNRLEGNVVEGTDGVGIHLVRAEETDISGNRVFYSGVETYRGKRAGILLESSDRNQISNNEIPRHTVPAIVFEASDGNSLSDNEISNVTLGISLDSSNDNTIRTSSFESSYRGIELVRSHDNRLDRLSFTESGGISLEESDRNTMTRNLLEDGRDGIRLTRSHQNTISRNIVTRSAREGFALSESDNNTLSANEVRQAGRRFGSRGGFTILRSDHTSLVENAANENSRWGFYIAESEDVRLTESVAMDNTEWDFYAEGPSLVRADGVQLAPGTTVSFSGQDIALRATDPPATRPTGPRPVGPYLNVTTTADDAWVFLNVSYPDSAVTGLDESAFRLLRLDERGTWAPVVGTNGVVPGENYVFANVTDFGVVTPGEANRPLVGIEAVSLLEGERLSLPVEVSDEDSRAWTTTVDFGDGSVPQTYESNAFDFVIDHTYRDDGRYPMRVEVCDEHDLCTVATQTVVVRNVAPAVTVNGTAAPPGEPTSVTSTFTDQGAGDTHAAEIAWGDGTVETVSVITNRSRGTVVAAHTYTNPGTYEVAVRVTDDDGGVGTSRLTFAITVADPRVEAVHTPVPSPIQTPTPRSTLTTTGPATPPSQSGSESSTPLPGFGALVASVALFITTAWIALRRSSP
ncbi:MAG: right-handed parallel beta-helix repeat-containing protein [Halobacteriales archaeon]|nr:right-handed parallel beta-helix repeat-containing protein [Halobacteriales archaeon]